MGSELAFSGDVPKHYDAGMGPVLFEPYGENLAGRIPSTPGFRLLELAAGTGRVTRQILEVLAPDASVTATDLNDDMMEVAKGKIRDSRVVWKQANAMDLPFADASFDMAVCQFGVMFFPDKPKALAEARRVLVPGGTYVYTVWGSVSQNSYVQVLLDTMARLFPADPPGFMAIPFAYCDPAVLRSDAEAGGFTKIDIEEVELPLVAPSAESFARGLVEGSPMAASIAERGVSDMTAIVREVGNALRQEYGDEPLRTVMSAYTITAQS